MVIAALFRRFDFDLSKTDYEDVRIVRNVIAPDPRPDSKGVRVVIGSSCFAKHSGHRVVLRLLSTVEHQDARPFTIIKLNDSGDSQSNPFDA